MNNTKVRVSYPFECNRCGLVVRKQNASKKAHRNGKCRKGCDGIQRNRGGYPLDPLLRQRHVVALKEANKIKKRIMSAPFQAPDFYQSRGWLEVRHDVLKRYGGRCMLCGDQKSGMHVDHIKPRSKYPELALDINNLQVLCRDCNLGKSNRDQTDWRPKIAVLPVSEQAFESSPR